MSFSAEEQLRILTRGVVDLVSEAELGKRIASSIASGKPLRVKAGFDPTRPDLHLGHTVLMEKMRQFQELGHEVYFVIGDFTASIGDPSGRNKTRPPLTREEIEAGARTYADQAFKILDREKTKLVYNGTWLSPMGFADVIRLAGRYTLARMMERQDFKTRWEEGTSISIHELLYPLAQAYDSVELRADIELGGTDQLFNLMVGRDLMREYGLAPQMVMTTPILEGLSARAENGRIVGDKMSKSLDNYVGVSEPPTDQFGKLMSISDDLMWRYYELLSKTPLDEVQRRREACASGAMNPRDAKFDLGVEIVARFHDRDSAERARAAWEKQFSKREAPDAMPEHTIAAMALVPAMVVAELAASNAAARRLIEQGGVEIDGTRVTDVKHTLAPGLYTVKVGKRGWAKLVVT